MRVACLRVADLPLAARLRAEPELAGSPLVIVTGAGARAEIVSVSPEAARLGVRRGQTAAQARAVEAEIRLRASAPELENAAREALRDAALSVSPRAEIAPPAGGAFAMEAVVFADATGVGSLFRSEAGFATALAARAAALGLPARVALAGSRAVARLAARAPGEAGEVRVLAPRETDEVRVLAPRETGEVRVLAPEEEAAWLAPLAVDLLDPSDALSEALGRFGIRRIGELARLPRRALATRLGPEALQLVGLARGGGDGVPIATPVDEEIVEALELEAPLERLEPLLFVLRAALDRLAARLDARGLAADALELALCLEGGGRDVRRIALAAPTPEVRTWLRVASLALEAHPPGAAIETLRVTTRGVPVRRDQLDLFRPAGPAAARLGRTLAELEALCGAGRVGVPVPPDAHRCDAFGIAPFVLGGACGRDARCAPPGDGEATTCALRALRPPVRARVRTERGRPASLASAVANGRVLGCAGPWRTSGSWWAPEGRFSHDHYDVWTSDGTVTRLRHDRILNDWSIDGVYD